MSDTEARSLDCPLTPDECKARADEAGRLEGVLSAELIKQTTMADELKVQKKHTESLTAEIRRLLAVYSAGSESRQVECEKRYDRAAQKIYIVRTDTGEVIETQEMPRQQGVDAPMAPVGKAPELVGVEPGQQWRDDMGHTVTVQAVSNDGVVARLADGSTMRINAVSWGRWQQVGALTESTVLRALDSEGKTIDQLASELHAEKDLVKLALQVLRAADHAALDGKLWSLTDAGRDAT